MVVEARSAKTIALADEKSAPFWRAHATLNHGCVLALTDKMEDAVHVIASGIAAWRSAGATMFLPMWLTHLADAYAGLGRFDDALRCVGEAKSTSETTGERWCEAEVYRVTGEIALMVPKRDALKAETHFERALGIARQQQAKSWELRAAMSLARLWRDQGKVHQARELLAPVY